MKLTKQGVRDLGNGGRRFAKPFKQDICFHDYDHDPDCSSCDCRYYGDGPVSRCSEKCRKCEKIK